MRVHSAVGITVVSTSFLLLTGACGSSSGGGSKNSTQAVGKTSSPAVAADNGVASKSPQEILAVAAQSLRQATSVHVHGSLSGGGQNSVGALDLHLGQDSGQGTITAPVGTAPVQMDIIFTGGKLYVRSQALWKQVGGDRAAQLMGDRWGIFPTNGSHSEDLLSFTSVGGMATAMVKDSGTITPAGRSTFEGQPVVGIKDGDGTLMYVTTTGEAHLIHVDPSDAKGGEGIDFTEWNAPLTITAPPGAIDFAKLKSIS